MGPFLDCTAGSTRKKVILLLSIGLVVAVSGAWAQDVVHFNPPRGELVLEFDGLQIQREESSTARQYTFEERIRIGSGGYVLHPGILNFSAEFSPFFSQDFFEGEGDNRKNNTRSFDYFGNMGILQSKTISMDVQGTRSTGVTTENIGNRREFQTDTFRVGTTFTNSYLPMGASYSKRTLEQTEISGPNPNAFDTDEVEDILSFWGRNSKLNLSLDRTWFEDQEEDRRLTTDKGRLFHRLLRWGKGSSLDYDIDYENRNGFLPVRRVITNERLHLQHTKNLYSTYSHNYTSQSRENETKSHSGDFSLNHLLYQNLNTRLNLAGYSADSEAEQTLSYGGGLSLSYTKKLPWKGRFRVGVGGGYRIDDIESQAALSEVIGEEHLVNVTRTFTLDQRFVDLSSVVVTNSAGTIVYIEGQDYDLEQVGSVTQVNVLIGGRINVGEILSVDYRFETLPSRKFATTSYNYETAVDFGWVSLYHRMSESDQDLLSGQSGTPLTKTEDSTTGVTFTYATRASRARLNAERRSYRFDDFKSDTIALKQSLYYSFSWKAALSFNASQVFFDSSASDSFTFREDLLFNWKPKRNLFLDLHAGMWERKEDDDLGEKFYEADAVVRWFVGKVEIYSKYSHQKWGGDFGDRDEDRLTFTFKRRF
jgi:hypothetical protein